MLIVLENKADVDLDALEKQWLDVEASLQAVSEIAGGHMGKLMSAEHPRYSWGTFNPGMRITGSALASGFRPSRYAARRASGSWRRRGSFCSSTRPVQTGPMKGRW